MTLSKTKTPSLASVLDRPADEREAHHAAFERLADEWESETILLSSSDQAADHPAHHAIIDMGEPVVPLILARMRSQGGHWFHALQAITGANPIKPSERGNIPAMQAAWQEWGKLNGYA